MGIFHKTLTDAQNAINSGNFEKAISILRDHEAIDFLMADRITGIKRLVTEYEGDIRRALVELEARGGYKPIFPKERALEAIDAAKNKIHELRRLISIIMDEELKLE